MKSFRLCHSMVKKFAVAVLFLVLTLPSGISLASAEDLVRDAQAALTAKGFDPGPVDGIWGSKTKMAVIKFQESEVLTPTGTLDGETKRRLLGETKVSTAKPAPAAQTPPSSRAERMPEGETGPDVPDSEIVWGRHK